MCCRHRLQHALDDVYVLAQVLGQTVRGVTAFVAVCIGTAMAIHTPTLPL